MAKTSKALETTDPFEAAKKAELEKYGVAPTEKVEVKDPLTGEKRIVSLDRTGYGEAKLITALADPDLPRDRKDFMLSMYLFERGKDSASFIADIMRYKGAHTKETRVFKSQMRFDFETLVTMLAGHLRDRATRTGLMFGVDIATERAAYQEWLAEHKGEAHTSYFDYYRAIHEDEELPWRIERIERQFIAEAIFELEEAIRLEASRRAITEMREREKGKGIYLDSTGKPYLQDDLELDEAIARDRALTKEAQDHV